MEPSSKSSEATAWSRLLQKEPPAPSPGKCISAAGVSVAVLDASAIVNGGNVSSFGDRFVTVREVLEEVRDPVSRQRISLLPFTIETMEPSADSIKKVVSFARDTGDLQTLSDVDMKLIALTYSLEAQLHGTDHLKSAPPPIKLVNLKSLPELEMPGWGSNVPNLEEWEALEQAEDHSITGSRILPLKDLNVNVDPSKEDTGVSEHVDEPLSSSLVEESKMGKKMVVSGIDASRGEDTGNSEDWLPAVSRSSHKRYLRRKARTETSEDTSSVLSNGSHEEPVISFQESDLSSGIEHISLNDENEAKHKEDEGNYESHTQSNSSVACVTGDFAMQNVILQMGLRLLAPSGMQIRQLHRWVLRCHACNKVTSEIGRLFCPKCGNGGTMRKVSVTVGENELVLASRKPRINLRGTKFSIPMPQGGRDGVAKNPVLREDQIPRKYLYPKGMKKKKNSNKQEDFMCPEDIFSNGSDRRAPVKPPVGKAVLVFTGKKNPNDNHFSRRH